MEIHGGIPSSLLFDPRPQIKGNPPNRDAERAASQLQQMHQCRSNETADS